MTEDGQGDTPPGLWSAGALHQHFTTRLDDTARAVDARLADLQGQLDRRIQTQASERKDTERHLSELIAHSEEALREHVRMQASALAQADQGTRDLANSLSDQQGLQFAALKDSIDKSEANIENRLHELNRIREQALADREQFTRKDAWEAKNETLHGRIDALERRQDLKAGAEESQALRQASVHPWQLWLAGAILAIFLATVSVAANVLSAT